MYLSLLLVDGGTNPDRPRPGRLWIGNAYRVHQRLAMAFPDSPHETGTGAASHVERGKGAGVLFRIEAGRVEGPRVLVQSEERPDWDRAFANALFLLRAGPAVKEFAPVFSAGERLRFLLRANATEKRAVAKVDGTMAANKRRFGLHGEERQLAWLRRKGEEGGFEIEEARVEGARLRSARRSGEPAEARQQHLSADFTGVLCVRDPAAFRQTLIRGIGPGKAFGFGLMSVARV